MLHDIGKMAISDTILQKPDVLSEEECVIMKTHPEKAYQILSQIDLGEEIPSAVYQVVAEIFAFVYHLNTRYQEENKTP
jgi:HD-GYP domain-containing protein (c-di-GMP phosphodiesterase class II)